MTDVSHTCGCVWDFTYGTWRMICPAHATMTVPADHKVQIVPIVYNREYRLSQALSKIYTLALNDGRVHKDPEKTLEEICTIIASTDWRSP